MNVVKLGGSLLENPVRRRAVLLAMAERWRRGDRPVLVHGGGKRIDAVLEARGIPRRIHRGLRVTDEATLEVVVSVLCGLVNKLLVVELRELGIPAAGLSGADGPTLEAELFTDEEGFDYGFVGQVVRADASLVRSVSGAGWLPVVASVAASVVGESASPVLPSAASSPGDGEVRRDPAIPVGLLNVNADAAASALAVVLGARRLLYLTDVPGFLDDGGRLVERLGRGRIEALLRGGGVEGGMRPKLTACLGAFSAGVAEVVIAGPQTDAGVLEGRAGGTQLVHA